MADFFPAGVYLDIRSRVSDPPELYAQFLANAKIIRVSVNGIDVSDDCFAFDEAGGWAEVYARNKDGHYWTKTDGVLSKRIFGRVKATIQTA